MASSPRFFSLIAAISHLCDEILPLLPGYQVGHGLPDLVVIILTTMSYKYKLAMNHCWHWQCCVKRLSSACVADCDE
jgi:hypothetical protein